MSASFERLKRVSELQDEFKKQLRGRETQVVKPYQAVELEHLTRDIQAAFGPTLQYMKGMDEYA